MKAYETHGGMYNFKHLSSYAAFLLDRDLDELVKEQIELSFKIDIPILKIFKDLSEEQVFNISKVGFIEYLTVLKEKRSREFLEESMKKWSSNQHEMVGKFDLVAEDITLVNYVRQKALTDHIPDYTTDPKIIIALANEITEYVLGNNTTGVNTYINILTEELRRKSDLLLEAQSLAKTGSFDWDFSTTNRGNSPEMRKIFETENSQSVEELLEKVHADDREKVKAAITESLQTGMYDCEFRYQINGKEKVLWARGIVHYDQAGKPESMTGTVQDITERKRIEQNLLEKTHALEVSNSNLEKFAFVASHDMQEPLRKIMVHADLLATTEKERLSEHGKELIDKIFLSTQKMKTLINDILNYSTIDTTAPTKQCTQLEALLEEVKNELEHQIQCSSATIDSDGLPEWDVYPVQMKQLLQNLVSNALKFRSKDQKPVIEIKHRFINRNELNGKRIKRAEKYLKIEVKDNGIGFSKKEAAIIFQVFRRLHPKASYEGSGLGLAICKKVVENHEGIIEASSEEGKGAVFTILLPQ